jgi:hypothetical protein
MKKKKKLKLEDVKVSSFVTTTDKIQEGMIKGGLPINTRQTGCGIGGECDDRSNNPLNC